MTFLTAWPQRQAPRVFDNAFNDLFDDFLSPVAQEKQFSPKVSWQEAEDNFTLLFDMPGVNKEDLFAEAHDGQLLVRGERKKEFVDEKNHYTEKTYGSFSRSFRLPESVDENAIRANYENGVLTLILPKNKKKLERKSIEIG